MKCIFFKGLIVAGSIIFFLIGCFPLHKTGQLMLLKSFGDNQRAIENYVEEQEALFDLLKDDLKNNRLKKETPKEEILSKYGEPIFCKSIGQQPDSEEECLWRYPTQYFSTDTVYLKFDQNRKLSHWEFRQSIK